MKYVLSRVLKKTEKAAFGKSSELIAIFLQKSWNHLTEEYIFCIPPFCKCRVPYHDSCKTWKANNKSIVASFKKSGYYIARTLFISRVFVPSVKVKIRQFALNKLVRNQFIPSWKTLLFQVKFSFNVFQCPTTILHPNPYNVNFARCKN